MKKGWQVDKLVYTLFSTPYIYPSSFWTFIKENTQARNESEQVNISAVRENFSSYFEGNFRLLPLILFKVLIKIFFQRNLAEKSG